MITKWVSSIFQKVQLRVYTPEHEHFEPRNEGLVQMIFLFKQVIFRFHVNFPGSKLTWHWNIPIFNRKYILKWWMFHCHLSFWGYPLGNKHSPFPSRHFWVDDFPAFPFVMLVFWVVQIKLTSPDWNFTNRYPEKMMPCLKPQMLPFNITI